MFTVTRFGKVVGKILGRRDLAATKQEAIARYGKGISISRVL